MVIKLKGNAKTREVWLNDFKLDPARSLQYRNHSPDGFNWGYEGSGPAQLALAIVLKIYGNPDGYQEFKRMHLAKLETDVSFDVTWDITPWYLETYSPIPWTILTNNTIVGNYSSPHPFTFEDGSIIRPCSHARAAEGFIEMQETQVDQIYSSNMGGTEWNYISVDPVLTKTGINDMMNVYRHFGGMLVIVPLPVLQAYKKHLQETDPDDWKDEYMASPFVTGRLTDRIRKKLSITKFCK